MKPTKSSLRRYELFLLALTAKVKDSWVCLPGMELALFGSLLLEDTSVFKLHWTGDETDFTAFFHQTSYPPVIVKFL